MNRIKELQQAEELYVPPTLVETPTTPYGYGEKGISMSYQVDKVPATKYQNKITLSFSLQSCVSGCGLGIFGQFIGIISTLKINTKLRNQFVETVKRKATQHGWHSLIATLGDTYTSKKGEPPTDYEEFIDSMGFKQVHIFANLVHSASYMQRIYVCDTKDLK